MQAGAMGLESIVTDINGCNEIIMEGENGIIIPPKNVRALTNAMKSYINGVRKRPNDPVKCRYLIESRFDQQYVWKSILKEYQKLELDSFD